MGLDGSGKTAATDRIARALQRIDEACRAASIPIAEATARWHFHHSQLWHGCGLIMGAASLDQLDSNIAMVMRAETRPLPSAVQHAIEEAWTIDLAGPAEYPGMGWMPVAKL